MVVLRLVAGGAAMQAEPELRAAVGPSAAGVARSRCRAQHALGIPESEHGQGRQTAAKPSLTLL
jgi:hypothetical protein